MIKVLAWGNPQVETERDWLTLPLLPASVALSLLLLCSLPPASAPGALVRMSSCLCQGYMELLLVWWLRDGQWQVELCTTVERDQETRLKTTIWKREECETYSLCGPEHTLHSPVQEKHIGCLWITHSLITPHSHSPGALTLVWPIVVMSSTIRLFRPKTSVSSLVFFSLIL